MYNLQATSRNNALFIAAYPTKQPEHFHSDHPDWKQSKNYLTSELYLKWQSSKREYRVAEKDKDGIIELLKKAHTSSSIRFRSLLDIGIPCDFLASRLELKWTCTNTIQSCYEKGKCDSEHCNGKGEWTLKPEVKEEGNDGWISVKDRLPEPSIKDEWMSKNGQSDRVLLIEQGEIYFGQYFLKTGNWSVNGRLGNIQVTHWMPLPKTPIQ